MVSNVGSSTAVSILGIGAIGSKIAQTLLGVGTTVTVWNRTPERTEAFAARGSVRARSAAEAAAASPLLIVCVTDYEAVDAVLDATADVIAGRTIVTLTTGSPTETRQAAHKAEQAGAAYLDGGVQTDPENIGHNTATLLYSGPRSTFEEHRATLETLGSAQYLGSDPAAAAVQDLTLFGLWYDAQVAYLRALETIRSNGIDVDDFAPLAADQLGHVVHSTADTAHEVKTRSYPRGPADLTEHGPVLERLIELRRDQHLGSGALDHIHRLVQRRIESGHGGEGLTTIIE